MSRKFLLLWGTIAFVGIGGVGAWWLCQNEEARYSAPITAKELYESKIKQGLVPPPAESAPKAIPWKETVRLAIGGLGYLDEAQNRQLGDLVAAQLSSSKGLELVERQELDAVLKEEELNLSGLVRAKEAVRVGKLLRADWFLLGTTAHVNGTNCLVVRLVDARTGITRDGTVLVQKSMPALAMEVADLVRQQRQAAAEAKPQVYLAIGTFEDLSVNSRQAGFASQLRGYLTATYQHSRFTLLERQYADILLQEMELDLAGLTGEIGMNMPVPMQSAFWLVDGTYQSYETTNLEVEVVLDVHHIFSTDKEATVRGVPGEPVCREVKQAIDQVLDQPAGMVIPSRFSEAHVQMSAGKRLTGFEENAWSFPLVYNHYLGDLDEQENVLSHHNFEEAIRAFDTVLLLEPTNREAKLYLAACYRNQTIDRVDEARNIYHELIEEPIQDKWTGLAQQALVASFEWSSVQEKARWFEAALHDNTNSALEQFYRQNAESAERDTAIASGGGDATKLAEQRLFEQIRSCKNFMEGKGGTLYGGYGLSDFQSAFPDQATAARAMADLLPKMESEFPELAPYLTLEVLTFQMDTNSPVLAEFQKQLEWCQAHPREVFKPELFWSESGASDFDWLFSQHLYDLAVKIMEAKRASADQKIINGFGDQDRVALGYAYMGAKRWKEGLTIFASFSKMPVLMSSDGPWGRGFSPVLTSKEADYCRKKLGLPDVQDPKEFNMDNDCFCLCTPSSFAVGDNGLWIAIGDQLLHLDFNLRTNLVIKLPKDADIPITTLDVEPAKVWVGTDGSGLIEFDKSSRQCRRLTIKDGLMMNEICCIQPSEDALWIGYGHQSREDVGMPGDGGIGFLNLSSHQFISFTPSLTNGTDAFKHTVGNIYVEPPEQPPRRTVTAIAAGTGGNVWFLTDESALRHFQQKSNTWDAMYPVRGGGCLATDAEGLYTGQFLGLSRGTRTGPLGLTTFNFRNDRWQNFKTVEGLPSNTVSTLTLDGHNLWVGGMGYIALANPDQNQILKFAYVPARFVDKIQIGGGCVWAQFNGHLYRAPLSNMQ